MFPDCDITYEKTRKNNKKNIHDMNKNKNNNNNIEIDNNMAIFKRRIIIIMNTLEWLRQGVLRIIRM